jgi:membrane protein
MSHRESELAREGKGTPVEDEDVGAHPDGGSDGRRRDYAPAGTAITGTGVFATLRRTLKEFSEDNLTDWAAALTYYGLLAIFPALIAMISILGLLVDQHTLQTTITGIVTSVGPASAAETFKGPINSITSHQGTAGIMLIVGLLGALWSASGYVGAFARASNVIYETPEGRPVWKLRPVQLVTTLVVVLLGALVVVSVALTGPVVKQVAGPLGVGDTAVSVWNIAKWPVLVAIVLLIFAVLYYATPNVKLRKFSFVTPGSLLALTVWVVASALFAFYLANFGSYDKTYGTLGGVVSLLVWFWITNVALLLGAELNAERERSIELAEGNTAAAREIQLEPRDAPKEQATT